MRVLVVEDHGDLAANIVDHLEGRGHIADVAPDGVTGLHLAVQGDADVIVLDLGLPGIDGAEVCQRLRQEGQNTPIIMLTARGELEDRVAGLDLGADDYLVKPVSLRELEARIRSQGRRARGELDRGPLRVGDLVLDEATRTVRRSHEPIVLTRLDFDLLRLLMRESPAVVSRTRIEVELWGDELPDSDTVRAHVHRLRRVVDHPFATPLLHTVRGVGYRLATDGPE